MCDMLSVAQSEGIASALLSCRRTTCIECTSTGNINPVAKRILCFGAVHLTLLMFATT